MKSPQEIVAYTYKLAVIKTEMSASQIGIAGFLAGAYISMGALVSIVIGYGFEGITAVNPAVLRLLMGITFPVGLIIIMLAGGELFTGNCAVLLPRFMSGKLSGWTILKNWSLIWISNFAGALFFSYFLVYLTEISSIDYIQFALGDIVDQKCTNPFFVSMLKGVGANWLVCLAVWLSLSSDFVAGKIVGIWFPIMTFVAVGYEHCIANMFFIPLAMMEGAEVTIAELFTTNLIPVTIGNIIGGALFVGGLYWYLYGQRRAS